HCVDSYYAMIALTQPLISLSFHFFTAPHTTEISTLSLHDALPICGEHRLAHVPGARARADLQVRQEQRRVLGPQFLADLKVGSRSEEHTSELQSPDHLVCRLLLEKKKKKDNRKEI